MFKPIACLLCALPLAATGLDALRTQLARPQGVDALKATVDYQTWSKSGDAKKPVISQGKATAWVEAGPQGLKLFWPRDVVRQALQEAKAKSEDPEKTTPTRSAMTGLDVLKLQNYFEPSAQLLQDLDQAKVLEEHPDTLDGKPCTLLVLKLEPRIPERERKYVKELEATAKVWVGGDGLPLAADLRTKVRGKIFLLISFSSDEHDEFRFGRINGHLVTLHHLSESTGSGGGESGQTRKVSDLAFN